jgi:hypothetical protein
MKTPSPAIQATNQQTKTDSVTEHTLDKNYLSALFSNLTQDQRQRTTQEPVILHTGTGTLKVFHLRNWVEAYWTGHNGTRKRVEIILEGEG